MKICNIKNCNSPVSKILRGPSFRCEPHRFSCGVDGCKKIAKDHKGNATKYCSLHRSRLLRNGSFDPVLCSVDNCNEHSVNTSSKPRCARHRGYTKQDGYKIISINGTYMAEHRYIMETYLKRKLYDHETVHHINGIRNDNRIENLELWSSSQPSGQRVEDKIAWAKEILREYDS